MDIKQAAQNLHAFLQHCVREHRYFREELAEIASPDERIPFGVQLTYPTAEGDAIMAVFHVDSEISLYDEIPTELRTAAELCLAEAKEAHPELNDFPLRYHFVNS